MAEKEELSDAELFDAAVTDNDADENQDQGGEQQAEEQNSEGQEQVTEGKSDAAANDGEQADEGANQVPGWRLREINEEKRRFAEENERIKAELAELRRAQQQSAPKKDEPKDDGIDPLLDPKGYAKQVREEIRQEMLSERREESLQRAAKAYKDEFKEAYEAAQKRVDPALRARMQESRDPGETLIEWHRENKQRAEIGNDLTAYKQRLREEALKDPEFRKAAMEAWNSEARQQPSGRSRVELPPSMSSASRASAAVRGQNNDPSDQELWNEIAG